MSKVETKTPESQETTLVGVPSHPVATGTGAVAAGAAGAVVGSAAGPVGTVVGAVVGAVVGGLGMDAVASAVEEANEDAVRLDPPSTPAAD